MLESCMGLQTLIWCQCLSLTAHFPHFLPNFIICQSPPTSQLSSITWQLPTWGSMYFLCDMWSQVPDLDKPLGKCCLLISTQMLVIDIILIDWTPTQRVWAIGCPEHHWDSNTWSLDDTENAFLLFHSRAMELVWKYCMVECARWYTQAVEAKASKSEETHPLPSWLSCIFYHYLLLYVWQVSMVAMATSKAIGCDISP